MKIRVTIQAETTEEDVEKDIEYISTKFEIDKSLIKIINPRDKLPSDPLSDNLFLRSDYIYTIKFYQ